MQVRVGCEFVQRVEYPTHAVLQVEPRLDGDFRLVDERWDNDPPVPSLRYVDGFGNLCRRMTLPTGESRLRYTALAEVADGLDPVGAGAPELPAHALPSSTLVYTLPSRLCPSDELGDEAWARFGGVTPGWSRVQAVCDWVHGEIAFGYGTSIGTTTAADVLRDRKGVCRDFAHLAVTLCRALNIPARYAFGYLPDIGVPPPDAPMDFCAWMEVYLGDRWWTFDPRNNRPRTGRVLIGRGRDAIDVAMVTTYGPSLLVSMTVQADQADEVEGS